MLNATYRDSYRDHSDRRYPVQAPLVLPLVRLVIVAWWPSWSWDVLIAWATQVSLEVEEEDREKRSSWRNGSGPLRKMWA